MTAEKTSRLGSPELTGTAHDATTRTAPSAAILRKCIALSQVRFGSPTGVARAWRAVASWLCVAGFRRVCLSRAPQKRVAPCRTPLSRLLRKRNGRQDLDD